MIDTEILEIFHFNNPVVVTVPNPKQHKIKWQRGEGK